MLTAEEARKISIEIQWEPLFWREVEKEIRECAKRGEVSVLYEPEFRIDRQKYELLLARFTELGYKLGWMPGLNMLHIRW